MPGEAAAGRGVRVVGTGHFLPPTAVDNPTLYEMPSIRAHFDVERARAALREVEGTEGLAAPEVFDLWARQVTGIRERRVIQEGSGLTTEEMCARAARGALAMAGADARDVDLILVASVSPADNVPNAACTVAHLLGVPEVGGFTLNGACAGFVQAVATAYGLIESGTAGTVLAISGDTLTRITDYADPKTAVLFSDGAGAALFTAGPGDGEGDFDGPPVITADYAREHLYIRGQGWEEADEPEPKLHMGGGPRVLRRAINAMAAVAEEALSRAGLRWDDVDVVVPHQANLRITQGLERHLELETGRVVHTIEGYGNASASTVGIALDEVVRGRHGPLPDPARIVLTAVGGGYTMGAAVFRWTGGTR